MFLADLANRISFTQAKIREWSKAAQISLLGGGARKSLRPWCTDRLFFFFFFFFNFYCYSITDRLLTGEVNGGAVQAGIDSYSLEIYPESYSFPTTEYLNHRGPFHRSSPPQSFNLLCLFSSSPEEYLPSTVLPPLGNCQSFHVLVSDFQVWSPDQQHQHHPGSW